MRLIILAAALALTATAATAEIKPQAFEAATVGSMHKLCTADESTADGKYALGFCYGWIEGVGNFYQQLLLDKRFDLDRVVCAPKKLTREQVRTTFVQWAKANPKAATQPALAGIFDAMKEKHPCK